MHPIKNFELYLVDDLSAKQVGYIQYKLGHYDQTFKFYEKALTLKLTQANISNYFNAVLMYFNKTNNGQKAIEYAECLRTLNLNAYADTLVQLIVQKLNSEIEM